MSTGMSRNPPAAETEEAQPAFLAAGAHLVDRSPNAGVAELVEKHADFVWRSLRRLGVPEAMADDATQQVFLVVQRKMALVLRGRERAFLFGVAMNVAAHARRAIARRREVDGEHAGEIVDPAPLPDVALDQRRARALLDEVLEAMPLDLRTAFVMFELEEMTMTEIAEVLAIPQGTVASRLRRAREEFHDQAKRVRARAQRRPIHQGAHQQAHQEAPSQPFSSSHKLATAEAGGLR
jgi:RNA polymerase sigma-70 factor, ECF subfamily